MKLYAEEPGHRAIRALDLLVVSAITRVEVPSALWRKARTRELDDSAASILISAFELDFHGVPDSESRFTMFAMLIHPAATSPASTLGCDAPPVARASRWCRRQCDQALSRR